MKKIINPLDLIGNTPLIQLENISTKNNATILAKAEFLNNGGSIKDRIALAMIENAEQKGILKKGGTIIEATSGNTGIGLAWIASIKGYKTILTMPDSMSIERRNLLKAYGAEIVLIPAAEGMAGAVNKANELAEKIENSFLPKQFENEANPRVHYRTTGPEIWEATEGKMNVFVAGVGTGGTITGVGKYLKENNPAIKIIAVEPEKSAVLSGEEKGPHGLQGIGAGFVPKILDMDVYDEIIKVSEEDAFRTSRELGQKNGLLVGISAGANVFAALEYAKQRDDDLTIVTVLPDTGERYLSTELFEGI